LIKVHYSALNYKDALSSIGNKGVTQNIHIRQELMPLEQLSSKTNKFKADDKVIVTSYDLGMNTDGGLGNLLASLRMGC
jgi:hypothetical protein